jgi:putative copper export protein
MDEAPDIRMGGSAEDGEAVRTAEVLLGVTRGLLFVALLILAGFVAFVLGVWRRPGDTVPNAPIEVEERLAGRWRRLVRMAWIVALLASIASLFFQASISAAMPLGEVSLTHVGEVMSSRVGLMALARVGLLLVGVVVWGLAARTPAASPLLRRGARRQVGVGANGAVALPVPGTLTWFAVAFVVGLLFTVSFAGHAGTTPPIALSLSADLLHLAAAGAWLGGLTALLVVAFPATRGQGEHERTRILAPVIARFSNMAVVAIAIVVGSGLVRSLIEVQGFDGLTGTSYGLVLLAKVGVFLPIIALGAFNNRRTRPACVKAAAAGTSTPALGTLRRLITIEAVLGILVVGMAAWLVNLTPPRSAGESGEHALRGPSVHAPAWRPPPQ